MAQNKQAWTNLSQLRSFGWFRVTETETGLSALSTRLYILQAMRMGCVKLILLNGSARGLKMAARYIRHLNEPVWYVPASLSDTGSAILYVQAIHTVVPETMPRAVSA